MTTVATTSRVELLTSGSWTSVCDWEQLTPEKAREEVAALVRLARERHAKKQ